jgi:hypothetical protein
LLPYQTEIDNWRHRGRVIGMPGCSLTLVNVSAQPHLVAFRHGLWSGITVNRSWSWYTLKGAASNFGQGI